MYLGTFWSFNIVNLRSTFFVLIQIQMCPTLEALWFDLRRRCAAVTVADSTTVLSCGTSKTISNTFVGVILIVPVIITLAVLYRQSSSDLVKAISSLSHNTMAAYVIFRTITRLYSHWVISCVLVPRSCLLISNVTTKSSVLSLPGFPHALSLLVYQG